MSESRFLPLCLAALSALAACRGEGQPSSPPQPAAPSTELEDRAAPEEPSGPLFAAGSRPRIMIVGDSIAAGPGCFKGALVEQLTENGYTELEFVGEYSDDCGAGVRHSATSCATAEQYAQAEFRMPNCRQDETFPGLQSLVATHNPDLILLQLGVNDVWNGRPVDAILATYTRLVEQARAHDPEVVLLVARIQKVQPDCDNAAVLARAEDLVEAVPGWAATVSTAASPVRVADLWTHSDWSRAETTDCVHPNEVGAQRMGRNWYEALSPLLTPDSQ